MPWARRGRPAARGHRWQRGAARGVSAGEGAAQHRRRPGSIRVRPRPPPALRRSQRCSPRRGSAPGAHSRGAPAPDPSAAQREEESLGEKPVGRATPPWVPYLGEEQRRGGEPGAEERGPPRVAGQPCPPPITQACSPQAEPRATLPAGHLRQHRGRGDRLVPRPEARPPQPGSDSRRLLGPRRRCHRGPPR